MRKFLMAAPIALILAACGPHPSADIGDDTGTDVDNSSAFADPGEPAEEEADSDTDADGDGFNGDDDCDDTDASTYPGAPELCDGFDNDCDSIVDEDAINTSAWYEDSDGDGYGNEAFSVNECDVPDGFVSNDDDCDDTDSSLTTDCSGSGDTGGSDAETCTVNMLWEPASGQVDLLSLSYELDCDGSYEDWDASFADTSSTQIYGSFEAELFEGDICQLRLNGTSQLESESFRVRYGCESQSEDESDDALQGTWTVSVDCGTPTTQTVGVFHKDTDIVDGCEAEVAELNLVF